MADGTAVDRWHYRWSDSLDTLRSLDAVDGHGFLPLTGRPDRIPGRDGRSFLALRFVVAGRPERVDPSDQDSCRGILFLPRLYGSGEVYLSDQLIYRTGDLETPTASWFGGVDWHMIPLPEQWRTQPVTVLIRSEQPRIGVRPPVIIGSRQELINRMVRRDTTLIALALVFLMGSVISLLLAAGHILVQTYRIPVLPGYAVLLAGASLHILHATAVKTLLIPDPAFWYYGWVTSNMLVSAGVLWYVYGLVPLRNGRSLVVLILLHIVLAGVTIAFFVLRFYSVALMLRRIRMYLYVLDMAVLLLVFAAGVRRGITAIKLPIAGVLVFVGTAVVQLVLLGEINGLAVDVATYGMVVLVLLLGMLVVRRIVHFLRGAARFREDLEAARLEERMHIFADIHDHLGGNLNDLAISLDRRGDPESAESIRATIRMVRDHLAGLEDLETLEVDVILGLRLMLVRRYTAAGRTVRLDESEDSSSVLSGLVDRLRLRVLHPVITELVTNDLKYGYGMSCWTVRADRSRTVPPPGDLHITLEAHTTYQPGDVSQPGAGIPGRGTATVARRIREAHGKITVGPVVADGLFRFGFLLPLGRYPDDLRADVR